MLGTRSSTKLMSFLKTIGRNNYARLWLVVVRCRLIHFPKLCLTFFLDVNVDADHNFMLFSATFPRRAMEIAQEYLADDFYKIHIGRAGSTHTNIKQDIVWVESDRKEEALWDLLMSFTAGERILIFANSIRMVDKLDDLLHNRDLKVASIHSQRGQREREYAL